MKRRRLRVAYADPPYFGQGGRHYAHHHPRASAWDRIETHALLIRRLARDFPDGWALSCNSTSLQAILPLCPPRVRVAAWVKPWASFKPNVNPAYAWEPVIFTGGRDRGRDQPTVRDWLTCSASIGRGLVGAKPEAFAFWLFELLNLRRGDILIDIFPGTRTIGRLFQLHCEANP